MKPTGFQALQSLLATPRQAPPAKKGRPTKRPPARSNNILDRLTGPQRPMGQPIRQLPPTKVQQGY